MRAHPVRSTALGAGDILRYETQKILILELMLLWDEKEKKLIMLNVLKKKMELTGWSKGAILNRMARVSLSKKVTFEGDVKQSPGFTWKERFQVEWIASSKALTWKHSSKGTAVGMKYEKGKTDGKYGWILWTISVLAIALSKIEHGKILMGREYFSRTVHQVGETWPL